MSVSSYHTDAQRVNPPSPVPSTEQQRRVVGPYNVILYRRWESCGGGWDIVTRAAGEVARKHAPYYPAAQRRFDDEVRQRQAELADALANTMLGLVDECHCVTDSQSCQACRAAARHTYREV